MQGFELNTEFYPPIRNLTLSFDYTYNHALDQSRNRVTRRVLYMPLHKFDAGVRYTVPWTGTRLDVNAIFVDQFYNQLPTATKPTNAVRKGDSQMTFDCRVSQKFLKRFEAYMAMNNMFDRDYEPEYGYPAQGRMFWFGLSAKY
jgi:outer membrane receptor protein involved in Fe transport